jgi:hypothetical protein
MPCLFGSRQRLLAACAVHVAAAVFAVLALSLDVAAASKDEDKDVLVRDATLTMAEHTKRIQRIIEQHRADTKEEGWRFVALSEKQIARKLTRSDSPMIVSQGVYNPTGAPVSGSVALYNPDPVHRRNLYLHVFVGPANPVRDVGLALATIDPRFPRLTWPQVPSTGPAALGLSLAPGSGGTLPFRLPIPPNVEKGTYLGNMFLFQADYFGIGRYFDRGLFLFNVQ